MQSSAVRMTLMRSVPRSAALSTPIRASRALNRGFASAVPAGAAAKPAKSMMPIEVYPLIGIISGALTFGFYVGYTHLRYDPTVNVMNRRDFNDMDLTSKLN